MSCDIVMGNWMSSIFWGAAHLFGLVCQVGDLHTAVAAHELESTIQSKGSGTQPLLSAVHPGAGL